MIRAAAKNHAYVAVVVDPGDYAALLAELEQHGGATTLALRRARRQGLRPHRRLRRRHRHLVRGAARRAGAGLSRVRRASAEQLRYGENPHQSAAFYRTAEQRPGVATARQLQGKELSYNNINDTDAAFECVAEFDPKRTAAVAIIKHANPCGVAEGATSSRPIARRWPAIRCPPSAASSR